MPNAWPAAGVGQARHFALRVVVLDERINKSHTTTLERIGCEHAAVPFFRLDGVGKKSDGIHTWHGFREFASANQCVVMIDDVHDRQDTIRCRWRSRNFRSVHGVACFISTLLERRRRRLSRQS